MNQRRAALERSFFHDMNNIGGALSATCELLARETDPEKIRKMSSRIGLISARILREIELQRTLSGSNSHEYDITCQKTSVSRIVKEIMEIFLTHEISQGKILNGRIPEPDIFIETDSLLLERILINMLVNAFEATEDGDEVRFWTETTDDGVSFCVWNRQAIPDIWIPRIFQRNFSTKPGAGRGLGTFVMKHFGEVCLGGSIGFKTDAAAGTLFTLHLPPKRNCMPG